MIIDTMPSKLPDRWLRLVVGTEAEVLNKYAGLVIYRHKLQYWVELT